MTHFITGYIIGFASCFLLFLTLAYNKRLKVRLETWWQNLTRDFGEKKQYTYPREHFPRIYDSRHNLIEDETL